MTRVDGREPGQLRPISIETGVLHHAEGSALIKLGNTWVLCAASVEERVPPFLMGKGSGWVTAEYSLLPRSTHTRTAREVGRGPGGRTSEIQRMIGRSLRTVIDMRALGERTITVDCDVLQADGGTRTAAITGGCVALVLACRWLVDHGKLRSLPVRALVAATSVGIVDGRPLLDLNYTEDSQADVDLNLVMTEKDEIVEIQGTAERMPFDRTVLSTLLDLAGQGMAQLTHLQREALAPNS
ncbi:MAG: ribonuclease PH [Chloroflexota bacterium]|nr:MAG: ribonuclease PH [Chloroflexota bacterium]